MRRLLLVSYAFPPMALPEAILATKAMGNVPDAQVDVVCAPSFRPWMGDDHTLDSYVSGHFGEVARVAPTLLAERGPIGKLPLVATAPDMLRLLNRRAYRLALEQMRRVRYDAVVTWSTWHSAHLVGRRLRRATGTPWLAHFSDPWTDNPFAPQTALLRRYNARMERAVLADADRLLYTSSETVDHVATIFGDGIRSKAVVIPHAYDPALYPAGAPARPAGGPVIGRYLGAFYGKRTPQPLFEGLRALLAVEPAFASEFRIELVGPVPNAMLETDAARSLPAGMVTVRPPVDYVESLRLAADADFLLVIDAPAAVSVFLPSKLIDYLGTGRPIVCISPPGAAASLVQRIDGVVADPSDRDAIASALRAIVSSPRDAAPAGRERDRFTVTSVGADLAAVLDGLAGPPGRPG